MASGTPVVAYGSGGVLETVIESKTGVLFSEQNASSLDNAIKKIDKVIWDVNAMHEHASKFNKKSFQREFAALIKESLS